MGFPDIQEEFQKISNRLGDSKQRSLTLSQRAAQEGEPY